MIHCVKTILATTAMLATVALADVRISGSGATFPEPLYKRWVGEYQRLHPNVLIDYQGIGSGGGIKDITAKTVAFCGTDAPMSNSELAKLGGPDAIVEIPSCAGAVVAAYNLPGLKGELKLTGELLADIYLGKISKWNDPRIAALNGELKLPDVAIVPAYRTDGSGTNFVFTNYLCELSEPFKSTIGAGKQVSWPIGQGGKGNPGVAAIVQQTPGAVGYMEQNYASGNKIPFALIRNKAGKFVKATSASVSAAGEGAVGQFKGSTLAANIWNQSGQDAYPIASFTYLVVYRDLGNLKSKEAGEALANFLWWATHDGQRLATEMDYAPLAPAVQKKVEEALRTITFAGQNLLETR